MKHLISFLILSTLSLLAACSTSREASLDLSGFEESGQTAPGMYGVKISNLTALDEALVGTDEVIVNDYSVTPSTRRADMSQILTYMESTIAPEFGNITGTPTTLSGYGITDAYTTGQNFLPNATNSLNVGSDALKWLNIYAQDGVFSSGVSVGGVNVLTAATGYTQAAADAAFQPLDANLTALDQDLSTGAASVDFSTAATSVLSLTVGGSPVVPFALLSESGGNTITTTATTLDFSTATADFDDVTIDGQPITVDLVPRGVYGDGSDVALTIPSNPELEFDQYEDFSIVFEVLLADYTPASNVVLFNGLATNQGIAVDLETSGALTLRLGDGTSTTSYTTTANLSAYAAYARVQIAISADRSGNAIFAVNGVQLETEDISAQVAANVTAGQDYELLDAAAGYVVNYVAFFNRALSTTELGYCYDDPRWLARQRPLDLGTSGDWYAMRDESPSTTNLNSSNVTLGTASIGGRSGILEVLADVENSKKYVEILSGTVVTAGQTYFVSFDYYIPSGQDITNVAFYSQDGATETGLLTVTDAWTNYTGTFAADDTKAWIGLGDGGSLISDTTVSGGSQYIYLDNVVLYSQGAAALIDLTRTEAEKKPDLMNFTETASDATPGTTTIDSF